MTTLGNALLSLGLAASLWAAPAGVAIANESSHSYAGNLDGKNANIEAKLPGTHSSGSSGNGNGDSGSGGSGSKRKGKSSGKPKGQQTPPSPPPPIVWPSGLRDGAPLPVGLCRNQTEIFEWSQCAPAGPAVPDPGTPAQQGPTLADVIAAGASELKSLTIPPPSSTIEPPGGLVLVQMPTNLYADPRTVNLSTTVLGIPVTFHVSPATYTWSTGDGGRVGPTRDPGGPYPNMSTTHTYRKPGTYRITLTTTHTATITIAGFGTYDVPGTATTTTPVATITAKEARTRIVN